MPEVGPDEEEGLPERDRQRVGEAIPEVETGGMTTFAVTPEGGSGDLGVIDHDGYDIHVEPLREEIDLALSMIPVPGLHDDARFDERRGGPSPDGLRLQGFRETRGLRLVLQDRDDGGGIEDHGGSARQAVLVVSEDLFVRPVVENGQTGDPVLHPLDLRLEARRMTATGLAREPLPERGDYRFGQGFSHRLGELSSETIGFGMLDA